MEAYTDFAEVYDTFMDETPYEKWADFLDGMIQKYGISKPVTGSREAEENEAADILESERNLVMDLGCSTGKLM